MFRARHWQRTKRNCRRLPGTGPTSQNHAPHEAGVEELRFELVRRSSDQRINQLPEMRFKAFVRPLLICATPTRFRREAVFSGRNHFATS